MRHKCGTYLFVGSVIDNPWSEIYYIIAKQIALNKTITQDIFKEFFFNPNVLSLNKYNIIRVITYIYTRKVT